MDGEDYVHQDNLAAGGYDTQFILGESDDEGHNHALHADAGLGAAPNQQNMAADAGAAGAGGAGAQPQQPGRFLDEPSDSDDDAGPRLPLQRPPRAYPTHPTPPTHTH